MNKRSLPINAFDSEMHTPLMRACIGGDLEAARALIQQGAYVDKRSWRSRDALYFAAKYGHVELVLLLLESGVEFLSCRSAERYSWRSIDDHPIHAACAAGHLDVVRVFLDHGLDRELLGKWKNMPLLAAVRHNQVAVVEFLLRADESREISVNHSPQSLNEGLCIACEAGRAAIVAHLIGAGADVNTKVEDRRRNGYTPLMIAIAQGDEGIVRMLLEAGAYVDESTPHGLSPLLLACQHNRLSLAKLLIAAGADWQRYQGGVELLECVAYRGSTELMEYWRTLGVDLLARDGRGCTSLMLACKLGNVAMVEYLLDKGLEIQAQMTDGKTALMWATLSGHREVVALLLARGAPIEQLDHRGSSALACAMASLRPNSPSCAAVLCLLRAGASWQPIVPEGWTALQFACSKAIAAELILHCVEVEKDINAQNPEGKTALMLSLHHSRQQVGILRHLLRQEASPDMADHDGVTALMRACRLRFSRAVKELLAAGAAVDAQDHAGRSALIYASDEKCIRVCEYLLAAGADPLLRDRKGRCAQEIIQRSKHGALIRIFDEAMRARS